MMRLAARVVAWTLVCIAVLLSVSVDAQAQRRITPVNTPATATQAKNEFEGDTARINARKRATMVHYHDDNGNVVYIDTVTGEEWRDSTTIKAKAKFVGNLYPLFESVSVGVNIFDPFMRLTGRRYGLGEVWAMLNLHNRYQPVIEIGMGQADYKPDDGNFTYKSPVSVYGRIGANYNFLYNSNPDYQFYGGLRLGLSSFSYTVSDVSQSGGYWQEPSEFNIPRQSTTAFYWELVFGCKVKLFGNISAGWTMKYHRLGAESGGRYGKPWYVPGFGTRNSKIGVAFSIMYTLPIDKRRPVGDIPADAALPEPEPGPEQDDGVLPGRAPGEGPDLFPESTPPLS